MCLSATGALLRAHRSRRRTAKVVALSLLAVVGGFGLTESLLACGGTPPPPVCGRATTLTKAPPPVILVAPGGGFVNFPVTVGVWRSGPCPPPLFTTVSLSINCAPPPGAGGAVVIPTPTAGSYTALVPVFIPAGPPRICTVTGTATTTWFGGATSSGVGDTVFCVAEPSPSDPSVPRLDLTLLTDPVRFAHPGDQRTHVYLLTNNDPTNGVTVTLSADSEQSARLGTGSGDPSGSGSGVYAISDPGIGDNFPIAFVEDLPPGQWLPLPADPLLFPPPTISRTITLAPGDQKFVQIAHRSWVMCANGSCAESRVTVAGQFADGTPALACGGAGLVADVTVPPDFLCPDGGAAGPVMPLGNDLATQIAMPSHVIASGIIVEQCNIVGQGPLLEERTSGPLDDLGFRGRIHTTAVHPVPGQPAAIVGQPVSAAAVIALPPIGGNSTWNLVDFMIVPAHGGAPDNYFLVNARSKVTGPGIPATLDSFFDVFFAVSLDGISNGLHRQGRIFPNSIIVQEIGPQTFSVNFTGTFDPVNQLPPTIQQVTVNLDAQADAYGLAIQIKNPCPADFDGNGTVDGADLGELLSQWGGGGSADLTGNGTVDGADLGELLSAWGDCVT